MRRIICVGAVYMDTILTVPHYPDEDTKLRATNLARRRGGNTANTLEVLSQLLPLNLNKRSSLYETELLLCTVLPDAESEDTKSVLRSLPDVRPELYRYRSGQPVAGSSYIIQSLANLSRTIVSANPLREMSVEEFVAGVAPLIDDDRVAPGEAWIHFEGREPEMVVQCVEWLRSVYGFGGKVRVSVECEKPDRQALNRAAKLADVVFYSRIWAEAHCGASLYTDPTPAQAFLRAHEFLRNQIPNTASEALLICTWGSSGAVALRKVPNTSDPIRAFEPAWSPPRNSAEPDSGLQPIDSVGAGDAFIAGMLYGIVMEPLWSTQERLMFAVELAGRKVYSEGFAGLGDGMRRSALWRDRLVVVNGDGPANGHGLNGRGSEDWSTEDELLGNGVD